MTIAIIGVILVGAIYAWDYRPQTLVDDTTSIKESYVRQLNIDTSFGSRNVNITVETFQISVLVIFWWQQGTTNAIILFCSQQFKVNSTVKTHVSVQQSVGNYYWCVV